MSKKGGKTDKRTTSLNEARPVKVMAPPIAPGLKDWCIHRSETAAKAMQWIEEQVRRGIDPSRYRIESPAAAPGR